MNPSEPTGQQQPEADAFEQACQAVAQKHGLGSTLVTGHRKQYFKEAYELQSLSRWREISVDGLPGEGDPFTLLVVRTQDGSHFLSNRQELHQFINWRANAITHWIPISELPS